jgi:lysophospholipase L1-like esterase
VNSGDEDWHSFIGLSDRLSTHIDHQIDDLADTQSATTTIDNPTSSGTAHITNPYFVETQEYLEETAARYGIPVAQVYDEFMGPDGTDDPQDRGLVMTDQRHPTKEGAQLIAEMLHDLGYDYANW